MVEVSAMGVAGETHSPVETVETVETVEVSAVGVAGETHSPVETVEMVEVSAMGVAVETLTPVETVETVEVSPPAGAGGDHPEPSPPGSVRSQRARKSWQPAGGGKLPSGCVH